MGQGASGPSSSGGRMQAGLEQHLEAVADAEDELLARRGSARRASPRKWASWLARILPAATSSP